MGRRGYTLAKRHDVSTLCNRTISATIRTMPDSLVNSDRSQHGPTTEKTNVKDHHCAPAHYITPVRDLADLNERLYAAVDMSQHRCFIMHGFRLINSSTFPMPLMEAMFKFMGNMVKKIPVFTLCSIRFHL